MNHLIDRFAYSDHERLSACAAVSDRVGQVAFSHPLLFFCLATGYGTSSARSLAIQLIEDGAPLRHVCMVMGVPYALRWMSPSIMSSPLTSAPLSEPAGALLSQRFRHLSEGDMKLALPTVYYGSRIGGSEFGLWLARRQVLQWIPCNIEALRPLAIRAWLSNHPRHTLSQLPLRPWSPIGGWHSAIASARVWLGMLKFYLYFNETPIENPWADGDKIGAYEIVPLLSFQDLSDEILAMNNCLVNYADRLASNASRLFSVRYHGQRVGTIEIESQKNLSRNIHQYFGPYNNPVSPEAEYVIEKWFDQQCNRGLSYTEPSRIMSKYDDLLHVHLADYFKATNTGPKFWQRPLTISDLDSDLTYLLHMRSASTRLVRHARSSRPGQH
jgi:hypothetical protein